MNLGMRLPAEPIHFLQVFPRHTLSVVHSGYPKQQIAMAAFLKIDCDISALSTSVR
jgi:hypothetical protein